jgi:hypothetical protein
MLATDPYVRVNDGLPRRLMKAPVEFEDDRLSLWFHPALFNSYMRRGHLQRE